MINSEMLNIHWYETTAWVNTHKHTNKQSRGEALHRGVVGGDGGGGGGITLYGDGTKAGLIRTGDAIRWWPLKT